MNGQKRFTTIDIALTGVFCALWAILNFQLGPLSFRLLRLPILHDFAAFFTLLLTVWATGKFGTASLVGTIGSALALLIGAPMQVTGFAASSVIFDIAMSASHHKLHMKVHDIAAATLTTAFAAYLAGVIIGVFFMNYGVEWALTVWGGWHLIGGIMTVVITLPLIGVLEKANVRKIIGVQ